MILEDINFPYYDFLFKKYKNKLYIMDIIRNKYVICNKEEWVRQNLIHYMIKEKKCNIFAMKVEKTININNQLKKLDLIIYNDNRQVWLIAECKNNIKKIDEYVFYQIKSYNIQCKAKYILITNGLNHYCCKSNFLKNQYQFLKEIPFYNQ
ncbi:MAG: type I restriction enzyme HsdR N-terminal domain-containing protein [Bacteroides sp.]|nr:MAG: type I restriction enzyme HsdR N-terminal domain-containing protein [Bacteroides sp.]